MAIRPGSKGLIRQINEALVLDALRVHGALARAEIAQLTALSLPTITGISARLADARLITEVSQGPSTGGRRPKILALNPDGGHVVGIWLSVGRLVAVTVNLTGEVVDHHAMTWRGTSPAAAERAVAKVTQTLASRSTSQVLGVGVTLSGVVDHEAGIVRHSGLLGWEDVSLGARLSDRLGIPVTVDKLVNALASSLVLFGEGRGVSDMLVVSAGHSIGLGIVLDGHVRHGLDGPTGSLGHTSISVLGGDDSRPCHCGARGCLETVASEWALRAELHELCGMDVDEAAQRADDHAQVQRIFAVAGQALGGAVANIAKVINPQLIVLGGEGTRLGAAILEPFAKQLHQALSGAADHDIDVHVVGTDERTWARGGACQSLTTLFQVSHSRQADEERA